MKKSIILSIILMSFLSGCNNNSSKEQFQTELKNSVAEIEQQKEVDTQTNSRDIMNSTEINLQSLDANTEEPQNLNDISTSTLDNNIINNENLLYDNSMYLNINDILEDIKSNENNELGYVFDYASNLNYFDFTIMPIDLVTSNDELITYLVENNIPLNLDFCILAKNIDNVYSYFYFDVLNNNIVISQKDLITVGKTINKIGIVDKKLLYTSIESEGSTFEIFSGKDGDLSIKNKLDVTVYMNDFEPISTIYSNIEPMYTDYMNKLVDLNFVRDVNSLQNML